MDFCKVLKVALFFKPAVFVQFKSSLTLRVSKLEALDDPFARWLKGHESPILTPRSSELDLRCMVYRCICLHKERPVWSYDGNESRTSVDKAVAWQ